jgi:hypothetical protein
MAEGVSRRGFLKAITSAGGATWLAAHWPAALAAAQEAGAARDASADFELLNPNQAADLAAIASRIFPSDDLPGATEAGVVYFIDSALRGFMSGAAGDIAKGLQALNRKAGARFATLAPEAQTALLKAEEASPFFQTVRFMTIAGMFAMPSYGGNRGHAGWKMLGFDHRHFWVPPFGHYDAAAAKTGAKR